MIILKLIEPSLIDLSLIEPSLIAPAVRGMPYAFFQNVHLTCT